MWIEAARAEREKYFDEMQKKIETGKFPGLKRVQWKDETMAENEKMNFQGKNDSRKRKASASCAGRQKKRMMTKSKGLGKKTSTNA